MVMRDNAKLINPCIVMQGDLFGSVACWVCKSANCGFEVDERTLGNDDLGTVLSHFRHRDF